MRRALAIIAVLLIAAAVGYTIYWRSAARTLADGIDSWAAEQRRAGYTVTYAKPEIGGFPFRLDAHIEMAEIAAAPGELAWRWRGPALLLHARPWTPLDFETEAPGRHELEVIDGETTHRYLVDAAAARGSGSFGLDGRLSDVTVALSEVTAAEAGREDEAVRLRSLDVRVAPGGAAEHTQSSLDFLISLTGLILPSDAQSPLGRDIERLEVEGAVMGRVPRIESKEKLREALAAWRDGGGTLELRRIVAYWGALELTGNGTFALDGALQPIGAMSTTVVGHDAAIDGLVADGAVNPRDGSLAKVLLAVLARPSPVDGRPELTVPLTLQEDHLWIGPAKLVALPRIEWP